MKIDPSTVQGYRGTEGVCKVFWLRSESRVNRVVLNHLIDQASSILPEYRGTGVQGYGPYYGGVCKVFCLSSESRVKRVVLVDQRLSIPPEYRGTGVQGVCKVFCVEIWSSNKLKMFP